MFDQRFWRRLLKSPAGCAGAAISLLLMAIGLFGPFIIGSAGLDINLAQDLAAPDSHSWFGKAENGVDILTSLIFGARISLSVAVLATFISVVVGVLYGTISGFLGGKTDALLMRIVDVLLAFPSLLLAIYIAAVLRPSLGNLIIVLCATGWVGYARLARAQVLDIKNRDYVKAVESLGASKNRTVLRHVLPNITGPIVVQASFGLSGIILAEGALSFLGLGVPPGTPSWGALLDQGVAYLFVAPHIAIFPGLCMALTVLGFNFLGDGLRDALDTKTTL